MVGIGGGVQIVRVNHIFWLLFAQRVAWPNGKALDYDFNRNQEIAGSIPAAIILLKF